MRKTILFFIFFILNSLYYSQSGNNCNLEFSYTSDSIVSKQNDFLLEVKNTGDHSLKIFKHLSVANFQIFDIQKYNSETKRFEDIGYKMKDIQFLPNMRRDFFALKKNRFHVFKIKVEDLIYHARNRIDNGYYRFRIFFEYIDAGSCSFSTNYLYYRNIL